LVTSSVKGPVQVWSLTDSTGVRTLRFGGRISGVALSPDGQLLAASSLEGQVKVWERPRLRDIVEFRAHLGAVRALAFSPDSRRLATAGEREEAVKLWDAVTWQELIALERPGESLGQLAYSADGRQLTGVNGAGDVLCWRVPSWEEIEAKEKKKRTP
jgi:WD40 repeat protein